MNRVYASRVFIKWEQNYDVLVQNIWHKTKKKNTESTERLKTSFKIVENPDLHKPVWKKWPHKNNKLNTIS